MRFRDMRIYIILSGILIAGFIVLAFLYVLPIKEKMKSEVLTQTQTIAETKVECADSLLDTYVFLFLNGKENTDDFDIIEDLNPAYLDLFLDDSAIICSEERILGTVIEETKFNYHLYIYDEARNRVGSFDLDKLFSDFKDDETYFLYSSDGVIVGTNYTGQISSLFYNFMKSFDSGASSSLLALATGEKTSYKAEINFGNKSYAYATSFQNLFFVEIIDSTGSSVSMSAINTQVIIFFGGFVVVTIMCFILMVLGFRRNAKLIRVDKRNYKKAQAIVIRIKKNGEVIFTNKVMKSILGPKNKLTNVRQLTPDKDVNIVELYKKEKEFICYIDVNDKLRYFNLVSILSGKSYYLIGFDITKQYLNNQFLLAMSSKNPITKLDNMLTLGSDYVEIYENSMKIKTSFVYINIVNFRETNKVFSRKVGDSILVQLGDIIKNVFPKSKIYHIDADRFIVVTQNPDGYLYEDLCNKLLTSLKAPIQVNNNRIYVTIKVGVYCLDPVQNPDITLEDVRSKLDLAMGKAKNTLNKDVIVYDSTLETYMDETNRMELALQKAIKNDEFVMKFQPQYDIFKNKIVSFEALIRWNHPEFGKQSPQVFIELAEQNGYILDIGRFVIQSSFRAAKTLEKYGCHVSINVSPSQIFQAGFVNELVAEFDKNQLSPGSIAIEITETFLMENFDIVIKKLNLLKQKGFSVHLDDFGTGYSSMLYLKDLPADTIKIDKEFTKAIETDRFSYTMVKKICSMGQELNLEIICEGVETQGQSNLLKQMGCRIIQGWLIGKAMPLDEAIQAIEHYNGKPGTTKAASKSTITGTKTGTTERPKKQ